MASLAQSFRLVSCCFKVSLRLDLVCICICIYRLLCQPASSLFLSFFLSLSISGKKEKRFHDDPFTITIEQSLPNKYFLLARGSTRGLLNKYSLIVERKERYNFKNYTGSTVHNILTPLDSIPFHLRRVELI